MEREEILQLLRDSLRVEVETESHYSGDMDGSGNLYRDSHTSKTCGGSRVVERAFSSTSYGNAPCMDCAPAIGQQADRDEDESAENSWRRLALQFDGHRMQALAHIRALLADYAKHAPVASEFLSLPPLSGEAVLVQRISAISHLSATNSGTEGAKDSSQE